jgi:ComF family protein
MARQFARLSQLWRASRRYAVDLLFPPECALCHADLSGDGQIAICDDCQQTLVTAHSIRRCPRCGAAIAAPVDDQGRCHKCRDVHLHFESVIPLGDYDGPLRHSVLMMKKWQREPLSLAVGRLTAETLFDRLESLHVDLIVPVPMHWTRRIWRATNSPDLLAEAIAEKLAATDDSRCLIRVRHTEQQTILAPSKRADNVHHAFRVRDDRVLNDKSILLVDDILTTGATCNDAARALKQAGANAVHVCVVARAGT